MKHYAIRLAGALACGYLGLFAARLLLDLPALAAAWLGGSNGPEIATIAGLPYVFAPPPDSASTALQGAYRMGSTLLAIAMLAGGTFLSRKLSGWWSVFAVHATFWTAMALTESAAAFGAFGRGPLSLITRYAGISQIGPLSLQLPLAVIAGGAAAGAVYLSLARLNGNAASRAAGIVETAWLFVAPVALLTAFVPELRGNLWERLLGVTYAPSVFAILLAAIATMRFRREAGRAPDPQSLGAYHAVAAAATVFAVTFAMPDAASDHGRRPATELHASAHWRLQIERGAVPSGHQESLLAAADQRVAAAAKRLGIDVPAEPLRATVRSTEDSPRRFRRNRGGDRERDAGSADGFEYRLMPSGGLPDARQEPLLLMNSAWGKPGSPAVAGAIARFAVGDFLGRPLTAYARRIACEEGPYTLSEVLDLRNEYLSPLVRDALGGAWIESLTARPETLRQLYSFPLTPGNTDDFTAQLYARWDEIESAWKTFQTTGADCAVPPPEPTLQHIAWHKGISFSHEVGGGWGYGSASAATQLDRIRGIGANSVAIVPYAFSRAPEVTSISFRTDETDERIVRTIEQAHRAGLAAVLKPQIWARRFTGDIQFGSRGDFDRWFIQYRRWLLHFARLGALHRAEMLVIGTELGGMTGHEDAWRGLIRDIRAIYPGELTYAANWHDEFEAVRFWDALDYVSVNFYFPLTDGDGVTPSPARLEELAARVAEVAARYGKRALFTEVGYPSVATAAQQPWLETAAALDPGLQRDCYEAVFRTFASRPWFAGFYWWKWPSHGSGGPFDESFSPLGKPALKTLEQWYRQDGRRVGAM